MCDICGDLGFVRVEDGDKAHLQRCACKAVEDAARVQKAIGTRMKAWTLDDLDTHGRPGTVRMVAEARRFIASPSGFLTIWGRNGTGKSMVLQAIAGASIRASRAAVYVRTHDMIDFFKGGIGNDDYGVEQRMAVMAKTPVLCLDELTLIRWTDWVAEQLESLLDARYTAEMPTVLAMDEDPAIQLHPRLVSRMTEGIVIHNDDCDFRAAIGEMKGLE